MNSAANQKRNNRAKACKNCSKCKRRCDMMYPVCSRCKVKGTVCEYAAPSEIQLAMASVQYKPPVAAQAAPAPAARAPMNPYGTPELDAMSFLNSEFPFPGNNTDSLDLYTPPSDVAGNNMGTNMGTNMNSMANGNTNIDDSNINPELLPHNNKSFNEESPLQTTDGGWAHSIYEQGKASFVETVNAPTGSTSSYTNTSNSASTSTSIGDSQSETSSRDDDQASTPSFESSMSRIMSLRRIDGRMESFHLLQSMRLNTGAASFFKYDVFFDEEDLSFKDTELHRPVGIFRMSVDCHGFVESSRTVQVGVMRLFMLCEQFTQRQSNGFIHSKLYGDLPPVLSSALAISTLYFALMKNNNDSFSPSSSSTALVSTALSSLEQTIKPLVLSHYKTHKFNENAPLIDQVAWIHAATIIQILSLFSSSIGLSGIGEMMIQHVFKNMRLLANQLNLLIDKHHTHFETWKLLESSVRTLLILFVTQNLYLILKKSPGYLYSFGAVHLPCFVRRGSFNLVDEEEWRRWLEMYPDYVMTIFDVPCRMFECNEDASTFCEDSLNTVGICVGYENLEREMKCKNLDELIIGGS